MMLLLALVPLLASVAKAAAVAVAAAITEQMSYQQMPTDAIKSWQIDQVITLRNVIKPPSYRIAAAVVAVVISTKVAIGDNHGLTIDEGEKLILKHCLFLVCAILDANACSFRTSKNQDPSTCCSKQF